MQSFTMESTNKDIEVTMEEGQMEEVSMQDEGAVVIDPTAGDDTVADNDDASVKKGYFAWRHFHGCKEAKGYAWLGTARGAVVMSNIFLVSSLIYLASEEAGCLDENDIVIEDCTNKVHGFQPPSLIANIAVISGLLSAFLMPLIGAIVDYTPHRRMTGILGAILLILIQATQIATTSATWFPMLILQAIAGFVYQIQVLTCYAYLPEIARYVGEKIMTTFTSTFVTIQFLCQAGFLVVVVVISTWLGFNDVTTAQLSQAINVVWISIGFGIGWKILPNVPSRHVLPDHHSVWTEGFKQVWRTAKSINKHYPHGLRWFLLAVVFAEAGAHAFTAISVVYLDDHLQMSSIEIGIIFLITLVATVPGAMVGASVTKRTNPNTSWKIDLLLFSIATFTGAFALAGPEQSYLAYVWGVIWGFILGWFYCTANLFFSMVLPKGQEAELTGFFVYCTQILVWLPPLVFTVLIENGVNQRWGLMSLIIFFLIAVGILCLIPAWEDVLKESSKTVDIELIKVEEEQDKTEDESFAIAQS